VEKKNVERENFLIDKEGGRKEINGVKNSPKRGGEAPGTAASEPRFSGVQYTTPLYKKEKGSKGEVTRKLTG